MVSRKERPKLVAIVGPTASGKSELALWVAKRFDGEIISADSWQVYKGFNIGTAKPSAAERRIVKHHLLDIRDARQGFNAPLFQELANKAIADIQNGGKLPILAGGTGLYVDSVLYDFGFLPNLGPDERAALDSLALEDLLALAKKRKITLEGVDSRNKRRVVRAIEAGGRKPTKGQLRPGSLIIGIRPPAAELDERIGKRVDTMLAAGLEAEVKKLAAKYSWDTEPMKGIGYREWREYFAGTQDLADTRRRVISATRNLAKRQWTWFKRNPDVKWFKDVKDAQNYLTKTL